MLAQLSSLLVQPSRCNHCDRRERNLDVYNYFAKEVQTTLPSHSKDIYLKKVHNITSTFGQPCYLPLFRWILTILTILALACLSTVVSGQRRQKSRPELWSIAHWDIGHSSAGPSWSHLPPAAPNLHSAAFPSQCKTQPTPTGLEDKYFPWKGHKWDKLGHCKMGCFSPTQLNEHKTYDGLILKIFQT